MSKSGCDFSSIVLIQIGVINIPMILETLALKIAAAMFPRAMETITTDEETVDGKAARKKIPTPILPEK